MPPENLAGRTVASYQLQTRIGEGGTATVYRATHPERGICAVKILRAQSRQDATAVKRFLREAGFGARVTHDNVVRTWDYGEEEGLYYLALAHIIGHASLRTLQFLRAGSVLQDLRMHENAMGQSLAGRRGRGPWLPESVRLWCYRFGLERGYLDDYLATAIAHPLLTFFRACDGLERRWTDFLAGGQSRESDRLTPAASPLEDLT